MNDADYLDPLRLLILAGLATGSLARALADRKLYDERGVARAPVLARRPA